MFYVCNVAVLQAKILQKNEGKKKQNCSIFFFKGGTFLFLKRTKIILEFIYIHTEMEIYFHLGTLCNSAFIKIISSKCYNMRITYDIMLEIFFSFFFHIAHDYQAVNCTPRKNQCKNTGKNRFSILIEYNLHIYLSNALFHFSFDPSERRTCIAAKMCSTKTHPSPKAISLCI